MDEKHRVNIEKIEAGQQASMIESIVGPFIDEEITKNVAHLTSLYRGGTYTHDQILGKVAEITALMNLMNALDSQQRVGDIAASKEYAGGPKASQ